MKKRNEGRRARLGAVLLIALTLTLSSCSLSSVIGGLNDGGSSVSDGQAAGETNTTVNNNQVTVNVEGDGGEIAAAAGLRSAVSVYCTFSVTTGGTSPWNPRPTTQTYYSTGAGIVYSLDEGGDAFIVTNYHVVYQSGSDTEDGVSDQIYIYLYGMESEEYAIPASFVGGSAAYDIAVLRVEDSELLAEVADTGAVAAVTVGDSDGLRPGMATYAIGNPSSGTDLGGISVTKGVVSVESEYIVMSASDGSGDVSFRVIRTDTAVNSGNSGGGLFNERGELVGIVNAKLNSSSYESIGYAIPSSVVRAVTDNIIDNCFGKDCSSVMRAVVGIGVEVTGMHTVYDPETALITKVEEVSVGEVTADGLANGLIQSGDVIKSITVGDKTVEVTRRYHVFDAMLDARAGDSLIITALRDGAEVPVSITVTEECLVAN